jgi:predicted dehydrogenase
MLKVAIIGCGKIADAHAAQIRRIQGCEIVGVCDREPLMARQLYDRFPVRNHYTDVATMLAESRPDVVHITTPPESHYPLAKLCLEQGSHVYVEKPFTLYPEEAQRLITLAQEHELKLTVGHDDQFSHVARRMRALVQTGYLGSGPVHLESYYCYEMGQSAYSSALLSDKQHWVRRLPGKLLQNIISHGIARIAEFLETDSPSVMAYGLKSLLRRSRVGRPQPRWPHTTASYAGRTTAYFTFSSQMRPALHQFRIYGSKNGMILDQDQETLIKLRGTHYKSYVEKFVPPISMAKQYLGNLSFNVGRFLKKDFQMKSGMKCLIESFYDSIRTGAPLPISYREIALTAKIMDSIFAQLNERHPEAAVKDMVALHAGPRQI